MAKKDILLDVEGRHEGRLLEKANNAEINGPVRIERLNPSPLENHLAGVALDGSSEDLDEGRLAGAIGRRAEP